MTEKHKRKLRRVASIYAVAAFTLLALLSALYFTRVRDYRTASRYSYELSFEQTAAAVSALSDTLEKSRYATGELCHALASEAFAEACAAKAALATLPFSTVEMEQTKGFLGTVGDFTHGLCARSGEFTDDERADVLALSDTAAAYSALLLDLREKAANGELEMDSREKRLENVLPSPAVRHLSDGFREAEENFPVFIGPSLGHKSKIELANKSFTTPGILNRAGLCVSIITDAPVIPLQYLPMCAGLAVNSGLDKTEAWKAITINPARSLGIEDRVGSLEVGKDADVVIWTADPLSSIGGEAEVTIIDGQVVYRRA